MYGLSIVSAYSNLGLRELQQPYNSGSSSGSNSEGRDQRRNITISARQRETMQEGRNQRKRVTIGRMRLPCADCEPLALIATLLR